MLGKTKCKVQVLSILYIVKALHIGVRAPSVLGGGEPVFARKKWHGSKDEKEAYTIENKTCIEIVVYKLHLLALSSFIIFVALSEGVNALNPFSEIFYLFTLVQRKLN